MLSDCPLVDKSPDGWRPEDDLVLRNLFEGLEHLFLSVGESVLYRSLIEHDVAPNVLGVVSFSRRAAPRDSGFCE